MLSPLGREGTFDPFQLEEEINHCSKPRKFPISFMFTDHAGMSGLYTVSRILGNPDLR